MFNLKNPKVERLLEVVVGSFVWMIVALAWNGFFDSILTPLRNKIAILWIIWYLIYALIITFFALLIIGWYVHIIEKLNDEKKQS